MANVALVPPGVSSKLVEWLNTTGSPDWSGAINHCLEIHAGFPVVVDLSNLDRLFGGGIQWISGGVCSIARSGWVDENEWTQHAGSGGQPGANAIGATPSSGMYEDNWIGRSLVLSDGARLDDAAVTLAHTGGPSPVKVKLAFIGYAL